MLGLVVRKDGESLPIKIIKIRTTRLHSSIQKPLVNASNNLVATCKKMILIASNLNQIAIESVEVTEIFTEEVAIELLKDSSRNIKNWRCYGRKLCNLFGVKVLQTFELLPDARSTDHQLVTEFLDGVPSMESQKCIRYACNRFLNWLLQKVEFRKYEELNLIPVFQIQRRHLWKYRLELIDLTLTGYLKSNTAKNRLQFLLAWIRWLQEENKIASFPLDGLVIKKSKSKERELPSEEQCLNRLILVKNSTLPKYFLLFLVLLMVTGARPIEILNLRLKHLDSNGQRIWLHSKLGRGRWIPIMPRVWAMLTSYVSKFRASASPDDTILVNTLWKKVSYTSVWDYLSSLNIQIDGFVAFRHLFCTQLLENKTNWSVTSYVMDHRQSDQLKTYQHVKKDLMAKEVKKSFEKFTSFLGGVTDV